MAVPNHLKFTANNPCPVCGGNPNSPRGRGERCWGFYSEDRKYANCTRDQAGGGLTKNASSNTYSHYLVGECRCGKRHTDFNAPAYLPTSTALGINNAPRRSPPLGDPVAIYEYDSGSEPFEVHKFVVDGEKTFRQCRIVDGKRVWSMTGITTTLYHQKEVESADPRETVYKAEGEKNVLALESRGLVATCNPGGAGKWRHDYNETFRDRTVVIIEDNDDAGRAHVQQVAANLYPVAKSVKIVRFPNERKGYDVSDFLEDGGTRKQFDKLVVDTPEWSPVVAGGWGAMEDIPSATEPVPTMPVELLPTPLQPWLAQASERAHIPLELVSMSALSALSSVIGRQVGIKPERYNTYFIVPNLWACTVGTSGSKKTFAVNEGERFLTRLEDEAVEAHDLTSSAREASKSRLKIQIDNANGEIKDALKGTDLGKLDLAERNLAELLDEQKESDPPAKRFKTSDVTIEKLGELLNQNPNGMMVSFDELSAFFGKLNRRDHEADRPFYLTGWNGNTGDIVDRLGRGHVPIPAVTITVNGGMVPGKLERHANDAINGGDNADGLLQRFQLMVYPDKTSFPKYERATSEEDTSLREQAWEVYKRLSDIRHPDNDPDNPKQIPTVQFTDESQDLYTEWLTELDERWRTGMEGMPAFESHVSKYRSLVPSLALIIHLAELPAGEPIGEVPIGALQKALGLCEYLELHARKIYAKEINPGLAGAFALSQKIKSGAVKDGDSIRDIYRKGWSGLSKTAEVFAAVEVLERFGWVRTEQEDTGGRPTDSLSLHPELRGQNNA